MKLNMNLKEQLDEIEKETVTQLAAADAQCVDIIWAAFGKIFAAIGLSPINLRRASGEFTGTKLPVKTPEQAELASEPVATGNATPAPSQDAQSQVLKEIGEQGAWWAAGEINRLRATLQDRLNDMKQGAAQLEQTRRIAGIKTEECDRLREEVEIAELTMSLFRPNENALQNAEARSVLKQLKNGPRKDSSIVSPHGLGILLTKGLAERKGYWNYITGKGIFVAEKLEGGAA